MIWGAGCFNFPFAISTAFTFAAASQAASKLLLLIISLNAKYNKFTFILYAVTNYSQPAVI
jgi:hypothetical protein